MNPGSNYGEPPSATAEAAVAAGPSGTPQRKTLSVKDVPYPIWQRARHNALASNMSFGDYVIRTLALCHPFPPGSAEAKTFERLSGALEGGSHMPPESPKTSE